MATPPSGAEETRRQWQMASRELAKELEELGEVVAVDELAPVVTMALPASAIRELASHDSIGALLLHEEEGIDDLEDSIAVARSGRRARRRRDRVGRPGRRLGERTDVERRSRDRRAGTRPTQRPPIIRRTCTRSSSNDDDDSPHGHAPGCNLYSANDKARAALRWAVHDQDCTIVNQSFHRSSEPGLGLSLLG